MAHGSIQPEIFVRAVSVAASIVALGFACSASAQSSFPTQEQQKEAIESMVPDFAGTCKTSSILTYDVGGYWLPASLQECTGGMVRDVSTGESAMAPGEKLFFINGRARIGSPYGLVRGYPNTAYQFARPEYGFVHYTPTDEQPATFDAMSVTLPFVPNQLYSYQQRIDQDGSDEETFYAYSSLRFIPGLEKLAYPLNYNSVVVRVDGYYFGTPNSLMGLLQYDNRSDTPYYEVEYFQRNEHPEVLRSVFLPVISIRQAGPGWRSLANASPFSKLAPNSDESVAFEKLAGLGAAIVIAFVWESSMGEIWREQLEECRSQYHPLKTC